MKNNNSFPKVNKYTKYFLLVPVILMLVAVIVGVVFKFNVSTEFKTTYTFTVEYNTSVTADEYESYESKIANILESNGAENYDYKFDQVNEDIALSTKVTIYNSKVSYTQLNNYFNQISSDIETQINAEIGGHINITDLQTLSPKAVTNEVINCAVVLLVSAVLIFVYTWIRYEIKLAFSTIFMLLYNVGLLLSLMIIFRIPFNSMFTIPFYLTTLISYVIFILLSDKIREMLDNDTEYKNEDLHLSAVKQSKCVISIIVCAVTVCLLLSMLSLSSNVIFTAIASLLGLVVATYSSVIVAFSIWTNIYSKDNDKRLKAKKLKKEQPKTKKSKDEDKIVV